MNDTLDLRQYLTIGLKWWWLLVLFCLVGTGTGYWFAIQEPPVYEASSTLMVGQSLDTADLSASDIAVSERLAQTYAQIAKQQIVLQKVVDDLQLNTSWQGLANRVALSQVGGTQLLRITVEAGSPAEAQTTADEVTRQLILLSPTALQEREQNENQRFVRQRLAGLQEKIEAGQVRLDGLEAELDKPISSEQAQQLQEEIDSLESLLTEWESNYTQLLVFLEGDKSPNYLAVIQPAQANPNPIRPTPLRDALLAGVVGLLLAAGIVFLIEYLDDTVKSSDDLQQALGLTPLGRVSKIKGESYHDQLVTSRDLFSPVTETYRMIRSNIQFMAIDEPLKSILVTSASPGEGKSVTTANLGVVMAQAGLNTIIIDADLRRPTQHEIFQIPNMNGLTDLLRAAKPDLVDYLQKTGIENLYVMPSGTIPPNPAELLGSERMRSLLVKLGEWADVVICDSPPVLAVADAAILSNRVDGVVLVTEAKRTRLGAAGEAVVTLQQAGANILGGVLNRARRKGGGYYYYHRYYSPNGRSAAEPAARPEPDGQRQWLPFLNR